MSDEIPEFDPATIDVVREPARKKPSRRRLRKTARKVVKAKTDRGAVSRMEAQKKRKVVKKARRGRPPGSVSKPKPADVRAPYAQQKFSAETYAAIRHIVAMDSAARELVLGIIQGLVK